jgi:hypothetical protein
VLYHGVINLRAQSEYAAKQSTQQATEQNENTKHTPDVRTKVSICTKHYQYVFPTLASAYQLLLHPCTSLHTAIVAAAHLLFQCLCLSICTLTRFAQCRYTVSWLSKSVKKMKELDLICLEIGEYTVKHYTCMLYYANIITIRYTLAMCHARHNVCIYLCIS